MKIALLERDSHFVRGLNFQITVRKNWNDSYKNEDDPCSEEVVETERPRVFLRMREVVAAVMAMAAKSDRALEAEVEEELGEAEEIGGGTNQRAV